MEIVGTALNPNNLPRFSADFDYFRIPPARWMLMLTRLRQLGLDTVTLPVPWRLHQPSPDTFDFSSSVRHNLPKLLTICTALNLKCIIATGPLLPQRGLLDDGLPSWLHVAPDIFNADFSKAVKSWLDGLSRALVAQQWPTGPIVALIVHLTPADPYPAPASSHLTQIRWPLWLRKRYQGIQALNAAYGSGYRTVNEVAFPQDLQQADSPLAKDAADFLLEVRHETQDQFQQLLRQAGWQIPIYPFTAGSYPPLQNISPNHAADLSEPAILNLQQLIQIETQPTDIAAAPTWATAAPIRADDAIRRRFRTLRQHMWSQINSNVRVDDSLITTQFEGGGRVAAAQDTLLKIKLPQGIKPAVFRLYFNGKLEADNAVKAFRGNLRGELLLEDDAGQVDHLLYLDDPAAALPEQLAAYLQRLLAAQQQTLLQVAHQAAALSDSLAGAPPATPTTQHPVSPRSKPQTPATIAQAQRGLHEAEAALKKAVAAIGGLEGGLDTIFGSKQPASPPSAPQPVAISAAAFEGTAQATLLDTGRMCAKIAGQLKTAAERLTAASMPQLTVAEYQQNFDDAVTTAQTARQMLLPLITRLRREIATEQLPLVTWRVHQRLVTLAETLRWGVLRQ